MSITKNAMQVRELCIKNHWFTCGDNTQYERLFERVRAGAEIDEIATIIWICSEDVTKDEIISKLMVPVRNERVELIRAMELIARTVNDESVLMTWFANGVADGDIADDTVDEELDWYTEDERYASLMSTFLELMSEAKNNGGLYSDGIISKFD